MAAKSIGRLRNISVVGMAKISLTIWRRGYDMTPLVATLLRISNLAKRWRAARRVESAGGAGGKYEGRVSKKRHGLWRG